MSDIPPRTRWNARTLNALSVPAWVIDARLRALNHAGEPGSADDPQRAARAWCEERGLSYGMTVLGFSRPNATELALGCRHGAGPVFAKTLSRRLPGHGVR